MTISKKHYLILNAILVLIPELAFSANDALGVEALPNESGLFQEIPSVYAASKYEQKVTKAPASISIVTADEIKKYGYRTFSDVLSSLRGFYSTNDRNYGYVGTRGFGIPSDYNTRLLLMIDGHQFNDVIFNQFDITEGFPVDIDMIERVEVVRGPSSSLYGNNAFFGVINVMTKRGRDQQGANIKTSYGSNDAYKNSVSYGNRFSNGAEVFLGGSFYDSQGYPSIYSKEFDNPASNNGLYAHNDQEQAKKLQGTFSYQDFSFQGLLVRRSKNFPTGSFGTVFNSPLTKVTDESAFFELKYNHTFDNQLNVQARVSYNQYRYLGDLPYDYSKTGTPNIVTNKDLAVGQWWRAELETSKVLWDDHRVTIGGQYQNNFNQYQANYDWEAYLSARDKTYQWALFIQDDYAILKNLTLNAGLRFDYFSTFGATLNPRLGLIYAPWDQTTVKLLYGTAFRAPNQYELNYEQPLSMKKSQGLQPEQLSTTELILEHYFNSHLRAELNLFQTQIKNIIATASLDNGISQYQNYGKVDSIGMEAQLEDSWSDGFQWRFSYAWQKTKNAETGQRLTNSPEHLLKLNLIAPLWTDKVFLGFETQYMSSRSTPLGGKVRGHVVNNLTLFSQNWLKGVEFSGGIYNMFNQHYFDPGSDMHIQNGIQQDGITFRIKAGLSF